MLDLGRTTGQNGVATGTEANFNTEVIEASQNMPVLVYFTATWCGPCKTMGPIIEKEVTKAKGKIRLVKYDVDQNRNLAAQMRVQSIPTVYAFVGGRPVDGFTGAKSASEIEKFVTGAIKKGGGTTVDDHLSRAEELLDSGGVVEATQIFARILQESPENPTAYAGLIKCHLASDDIERAEAMMTGVPEAIVQSKEIESVRASLALMKQSLQSGPINQLEDKVQANPEDHQSRFDLAVALHSNGDVEASVNELLELFRRDREWNDEAAKKQLFTIFDALKPQDPIVLQGRRKLSSLIFT